MGNSSLLLKPLGFSLGAYKKVFLNPSIYSGYMNTVFYVTVGTLVNILATCMAAYVLSRKQFMLRRVLTIMFIFTTVSYTHLEGISGKHCRWDNDRLIVRNTNRCFRRPGFRTPF